MALRSQAGRCGSLVDVGVYCVNTVRWLTGKEPVEATAYAWTLNRARFSEVEETMAFQLKFPDGLVLQASSSFGVAKASFLHVHGEKGSAARDPAYAYDEGRRLFGKIAGRWFEKRFKVMDEFALELDAFADCIVRNRDSESDGQQGLRDVAVMEAIYRSAREKHPVPIQVARSTMQKHERCNYPSIRRGHFRAEGERDMGQPALTSRPALPGAAIAGGPRKIPSRGRQE